MLKRIVPGIRKGSCGTTLIRERRSAYVIVEMSTPSSLIWPCCTSIICRRQSISDVLPLRLLPAMATCSRGCIEIETVLSTGSVLGLKAVRIINSSTHFTRTTHPYEATTPSNSRAPLWGHSKGTYACLPVVSSDSVSALNCLILLTAPMLDSSFVQFSTSRANVSLNVMTIINETPTLPALNLSCHVTTVPTRTMASTVAIKFRTKESQAWMHCCM